MMLKTVENGEVLEGYDRYTGFCKELADKIANMLGTTCKFCTSDFLLSIAVHGKRKRKEMELEREVKVRGWP